MKPLRTVAAVRYVTPLREGGSLPAIVEADDLGTYVLKFRGAGQGAKALVAEVIAGGIARALGLPMPEIVLVELDPVLGRNEPDYEIRSLIQASAGTNLGFDYLPGSIAYEPGLRAPDPDLAARIAWFDALVMNVDRTARNTNLLSWHRRLYLIDHGASLYFHHDWPAGLNKSRARFPQLRDHVLLPFAVDLGAVDDELSSRLTAGVLADIVAQVPDAWLPAPAADSRAAYVTFLSERLAAPRPFLEEAPGGGA
ncbi:MAG TPA: HipA family kinase [Kofleriaceae bacterium]|nr:HipA family kinase [Kofleriaceae bacterium]